MRAEAWATGREVNGVCAGTAEHGTVMGQGRRGEDEQQREEDGDGGKSTGGRIGEGVDRVTRGMEHDGDGRAGRASSKTHACPHSRTGQRTGAGR